MTGRIFAATRKGLFTAERSGGRWRIASTAFLGDQGTMLFPDPRDGHLYAALRHGHFGVKLHRSGDGGRAWEECATPAYPPRPDGEDAHTPQGMPPVPW